jgi:valyl-tRNA synthetase
LEISKVALTGEDLKARALKQSLLVHLIDQSLALLHPVMPYETEALYQAFKPFLVKPVESLMIHPWPQPDPARQDAQARDKMHLVQDVVTAIRTLRSEAEIHPGTRIDADLNCEDRIHETITDSDVKDFISSLAKLNKLSSHHKVKDPRGCLIAVFNGGEVFIPADGIIDLQKQRARLQRDLAAAENMLKRGQSQLSNQNFVQRAPKEEVNRLTAQINQLRKKISLLERNLEGLS